MHRLPFSIITTRLMNFAQIDCMNLEGYANLEHWVAELEKRIEGDPFSETDTYHPDVVCRVR